MTTTKEYNQFSVSIYPIDSKTIMRMDNTLDTTLNYILFDIYGCFLNKTGIIATEKVITAIYATTLGQNKSAAPRRYVTTSQLVKLTKSIDLFKLKNYKRPKLKVISDKVHVLTELNEYIPVVMGSPIDVFDGYCFQLVRDQIDSTVYATTNLQSMKSSTNPTTFTLDANETLAFRYSIDGNTTLIWVKLKPTGDVDILKEFKTYEKFVEFYEDKKKGKKVVDPIASLVQPNVIVIPDDDGDNSSKKEYKDELGLDTMKPYELDTFLKGDDVKFYSKLFEYLDYKFKVDESKSHYLYIDVFAVELTNRSVGLTKRDIKERLLTNLRKLNYTSFYNMKDQQRIDYLTESPHGEKVVDYLIFTTTGIDPNLKDFSEFAAQWAQELKTLFVSVSINIITIKLKQFIELRANALKG